MRKHISRFIALVITVCSLITAAVIPCIAASTTAATNSTGYQSYIKDDADLLTDSEEKQLALDMEPVTRYGNVAFISTKSDNMSTVEAYAENRYKELFGSKSGTIFIIDMAKRKVAIYSDGSIYKTITKSYANTITDNIYQYASDKDYYKCASKAFSQINTLLEGRKIAQPMKYICNGLLALIIALLINYFIVRGVSKLRAPSDKELLSTIFSGVNIGNPTKTFVRQTKSYSPRSSGSSGGGGGHSGGGGGGHSGGGGGGHSGGGGSHSF